MPQNINSKYFDANDVDLMEKALDLIPNLTLATYIAKLARKKGYPFKTYDDFLTLFGNQQKGIFKKRILTFAQVKQFFPKEFFPIENELQLLCRLLIIFQKGDIAHAIEYKKQNDVKKFIGNRKVVEIPAPKMPF
jgi:hypothetical protein